MAKKDKSKYEVGYGKPPIHTQFKSGKSGNPNGRPKKLATITDAFAKQARKVVTVPTKAGTKKMSMLDLLATKHWGLAVNGNPKSTAIVVRALTPSETNDDNNLPDLLQEFREKSYRIVAADSKQARSADDDDPNASDK